MHKDLPYITTPDKYAPLATYRPLVNYSSGGDFNGVDSVHGRAASQFSRNRINPLRLDSGVDSNLSY